MQTNKQKRELYEKKNRGGGQNMNMTGQEHIKFYLAKTKKKTEAIIVTNFGFFFSCFIFLFY